MSAQRRAAGSRSHLASETGEDARDHVEPAPEREARLVSIGTAAALTGVSERTLRYYEEIGLIAPEAHSRGGIRRYADAQIERVRRIRELQELLGLNLDEISALLERDDRRRALRAAWEANEDPSSRREILAEAIASNLAVRDRLLAKRSRIDSVIAELDERVARYRQILGECEEAVATV